MIILRQSMLTPDLVSKVITKVMDVGTNTLRDDQGKINKQSLTKEEAVTLVSIILQIGGTTSKCDSNTSVTLFNCNFRLAMLRRILKEIGHPRSERKLARTFATTIHTICATLEIPGNLYNKVQRDNPARNFTVEEKAWLSDFQTLNEEAPSELRELIANRSSTKTIINNQKRK